jgi:hypothetical protein
MSALFIAQAEPVHERSSRIGQEVLSVRYRPREEAVSHGRNCAAQFANGSPAPAVCPCGAAERSAAAPRPRPSPIAWRQPPDERTHIKRMSLNALSLSLKHPTAPPWSTSRAMGLSGGQGLQRLCPLITFRERSRTHHGRRPVWTRRPTHSRIARSVPRATRPRAQAKPCLAAKTHTHAPLATSRQRSRTHRTGEALFGGPTHGARTNATSRDEHLAWPPAWDGAS